MLLSIATWTVVIPPCWTNASACSSREREKVQIQTDTKGLQSASLCCPTQEQPDTEKIKREQKITTMIHIQNLKVSTCAVHLCGLVQCNLTFFSIFVHLPVCPSVCKGIWLPGIQWCWTKGYVWTRPLPCVTGRGCWPCGERGGPQCGKRKSGKRWQELNRNCKKQTGKEK